MGGIVNSDEVTQSRANERDTGEERLGDLLAGMADGDGDDALDAVAVVRQLRERD